MNSGHLSVEYKMRLSEDLRNRIKESAEKNNRTMNQDIVARLEKTFNEAEIIEYNDLPESAMSIHLDGVTIGLMQSQYKDVRLQKNYLDDCWYFSYYALRCIVSNKIANDLLAKGCTFID